MAKVYVMSPLLDKTRVTGLTLKTTIAVFRNARYLGKDWLDSDSSEVEIDTESVEPKLRRPVPGRELVTREIVRLALTVVIVGFGLAAVFGGSGAVQDWGIGALGAILGYWFR